MNKTALALLLCVAPLSMPLAQAQEHGAEPPPAPTGILSLDAQASSDVQQDVIQLTLFYEQQASDPAQLSAALNQRTTQTLRDAEAAEHAGVTLHTGQLSISPSTDRDGKISGWRGRSELVVESHDFPAAAHLAGRLASLMQVGNVSFSLSPEAERAAQAKLSGEAIASFRQQAQAAAQAFGYQSYVVRDVTLSRNNHNNFPRPMMMLNARAMSSNEAASIPVEAGNQTVSVTVSGSIVMTR